MKATGDILKKRRESLHVTLAEVSISTKISPKMLQAIEAGDLTQLPARTFLRGFVKSYASFLKLDVDAILKSFAEEMAALEPKPVPPEAGAAPEAAQNSEAASDRAIAEAINEKGPSTTRKVAWSLTLVLLVALIVLVNRLVQKYEKESQVDRSGISAVTEEIKQIEPSTGPSKPPETKPTEAKTAETKAAEVKPVEAKPSDPKPAEAKPTEVKQTAVNQAEAKPTEAKPSDSNPAEKKTSDAKTSETKPTDSKVSNVELILEALDNVDVTFKLPGGAEKKVSLAPNQVHKLKAAGVVAVEFSDGGAVNVIVNGREVGVPGDLGRPKKMNFP